MFYRIKVTIFVGRCQKWRLPIFVSIWLMKGRVKGYFRKTRKGFVYVKPYLREVSTKRSMDIEDALFKVFSWAGESLTHSVSGDWKNEQDISGAAILLGMSSDEGYSAMLKHKDTIEGKYLLKEVNSFIDRHGDTQCIGLYSGVPLPKEAFDKLRVGKNIDIGGGLPIYTTPIKKLAKSFSSYTKEENVVPCVFEVIKGTALGNSNHRSKHEDEHEVCFNSHTKVRVLSKEEVVEQGSKYNLIKVSFDR